MSCQIFLAMAEYYPQTLGPTKSVRIIEVALCMLMKIVYTVEPPKVGCKIGVFSKLQLNEPPKVEFLSEVGCGVRLLKF